MTQTTAESNINYGQQLRDEIKAKGYKKSVIAEKLDITINTLEARLRDGEFTIDEMKILYRNRYLPYE